MSIVKYRPDIDGLRAVAVIGVIVFHWNALLCPGGFVGVDVFFVISGYLITSILLREHESNTFSLKSFWIRRVRRLFPAAAVVCISTFLMGLFVLEGEALDSLGKQIFSVLFFVANFLMLREVSDYWGTATESIPMLHMWSLAVEEQFYLFYPWIFVFIKKRSRLIWVLSALALISFVVCAERSFNSPSVAFYLAPFRAWEFIFGASIFFLRNPRSGVLDKLSPRSQELGMLIGLGLIAVTYFLTFDSLPFPAPMALLPVVGTALILLLGDRTRLGAAALTKSRLVYIGKISYSLYLWHWPLLVFSRLLQWPFWVNLAVIPLSIASYELVEKPTRKKSSLLVLGTVFCALLCLSVYVAKVPNVALLKFDYKQPHVSVEFDSRKYLDEGGIHINEGANFRVVVLGNSMAYQHADAINEVFGSSWITYLTVGGTPLRYLSSGEDGTDRIPPVLWTHGERVDFDQLRKEVMAKRPDIVIASERWNVQDPIERSRMAEFLNSLATQCEKLILISECPVLSVPKELSMQRIAQNLPADDPYLFLDQGAQVRQDRANLFLMEVAESHENMAFLNLSTYVIENGRAKFVADGKILFGNHSHLSHAGSSLIVPVLSRIYSEERL